MQSSQGRTAAGSACTLLLKRLKLASLQAEAADDVSFANPLRRYANTVASDMRLSYRGTLTDGKLKAASSPANKAPEVSCMPLLCTSA